MADNECCKDDVVAELSEHDIVTSPSEVCPEPACVTPPKACGTKVIIKGCGCGHTTPVAGCCATAPITPVPFYLETAKCVQDHSSYCSGDDAAAIKVANSFNIPACGSATILSVPGAKNILVGGFLWNPTVGYLRVLSYDANTGQVTAQNDCQTGNAAVGTQIPACTLFIPTPPPSSGSGGGGITGPYLALDFLAPADGQCINISVTTAAGVTVGKNISIAGGTYRISAVIDDETITICNDGAGITANTPVLARNSSGDLQYPLILIDDNPCTRTAVDSGEMLVCHGGVISPLYGLLDGQIPVLDLASGEVIFKSLGIPVVDCTALTAQLTLDPLNPPGTSYLAIVTDTSFFTVSDLVVIGGVQFTVTSIENAINMHVQPVVDPVDPVTYPVGASICAASCCERLGVLEEQVYNNTVLSGADWLGVRGASISGAADIAGDLSVGESQASVVTSLDIINSTEFAMIVRVTYRASCAFTITNTAAQYAQVSLAVLANAAISPGGAAVQIRGLSNTFIIPATAASAIQQMELTHDEIYSIPAGETWRIKCGASTQYAAGNALLVVIGNQFARLVIDGVAMPQ